MNPSSRSFVGRERELGELEAALDDASRGSGSVWLVGGEPGIGKSRLAEEVSRIAGGLGFDVLAGRCWEAGGAPAFWPWVQVLRGLHRRLGAAVVTEILGPRFDTLVPLLTDLASAGAASTPSPQDAEQARFQVLEAVTTLLVGAAARSPLLVTLEDLQAADASSLVLLDFAAAEVARARIVVLGTYREPHLDAAPSAPFLARVARAARHLRLGRLEAEQVELLLARAAGVELPRDLTAAVSTATEGNPLFVVEMAR